MAMANAFVITKPTIPQDVQLYRIPEAARVLGLCRTVIYELIRAGRLRSVREGRAHRIPASAIRDYVALLETEARSQQSGPLETAPRIERARTGEHEVAGAVT